MNENKKLILVGITVFILSVILTLLIGHIVADEPMIPVEGIDCDKVFYDDTNLSVGEYDCEKNASMIINTCNNENLI